MHNSVAVKSAALVHLSDKVAVVRIPMHGSCAIPLFVIEPPRTDLITWAFAGFDGQSVADPVCLVVLGNQVGSDLHVESRIAIQTHIYDLELNFATEPAVLTPHEIDVLTQTVLVSITSANMHQLSVLFPLLADNLDTCVAQASGSMEFQFGPDPIVAIATDLDFIPEVLILRTRDGYACAAVESVRVCGGMQATLVMTLAAPNGLTDLEDAGLGCAIITGQGRQTTARVTTTAQ